MSQEMSTQSNTQTGRPKLSLRRKRDPHPHSKPPTNGGPRATTPPPTKMSGLSIVLQRCTPTSRVNRDDVMVFPENTDLSKSKQSLSTKSIDFAKSVESKSYQQDTATRDMESTDTGLGQFLFCHICQKDLTHLNETRRSQHINRCCDEDKERCAVPMETSSSTCLLCQKGFKTKEVMLSHMKVCAKRKGISTAHLLSMQREEATAESTSGSATTVKQEERPHLQGKKSEVGKPLTGGADGDFVVPPPVAKTRRGRKRKQGEQVDYIEMIEDEQLQMALALSASMDPQAKQTAIQCCEPGQKKKKRGKKDKSSEIPLLLTTTSSQAENVVAQRAGEILATVKKDGEIDSDDDIPCTPAFGASGLAHHKKSPSEDKYGDELMGDLEICQPLGISTTTAEDVSVKDVTETVPVKLEEQNQDEERTVLNWPCMAELPNQNFVSATGSRHSTNNLGYQTLWQLSSYGELEEDTEFYVPALSSMISPVKSCPKLCRMCGSDPCIALVGGTSSCQATTRTEADDDAQDSVPPGGSVHSEGTAKLIADLCTLVGSSLLSDVVITTENGTEIPAHAAILSCRCPALREVIAESTGRPISLDFSDFDDEIVFAFLRYLYTGQIPLGNVWRRFTVLAHRWSLHPETENSGIEDVQMSSGDPTGSSVTTMGSHTSPHNNRENAEDDQVETDSVVEEINTSLHENSHADPVPDDACVCTMDQPILEIKMHKDGNISHRTLESGNVTMPSATGSDSDILVLSSPDLDQRKEHISPSPCSVNSPPSSSSLFPIVFHNDSPTSRSEILISGSEAISDEILVCSSPEAVVCGSDEECSFVIDDQIADTNVGTTDDILISDQNLDVGTTDDTPFGDQNLDVGTTDDTLIGDQNLDVGVSDDTLIGDWNLDVRTSDDPVPLRTTARHAGSSFLVTPVQCDKVGYGVSATPCCDRTILESDDNITPMPDYRTMRTPLLKSECSRFGVKQLAKTKMIAKLEEIYEYKHPLVDEDDIIVQQTENKGGKKATTSPTRGKPPLKKRAGKQKRSDDESSQHTSRELEVAELVREFILSNEELYRDILLYKPLELSFIQSKLKSAGITVGKEKLEDILDCLCVTYSLPRNPSSQRTSRRT